MILSFEIYLSNCVLHCYYFGSGELEPW